MEAILTFGLVSVILGTASGAQNLGVIGALGVGGYIALAGPWAQPSILEAKVAAGPRARAFVCKGPTCSPPVTEVAELTDLLTAP